MKHITFLHSDVKAYKKAKKESKKNIYKSQLIQIFTSLTNTNKIQKLLDTISKEFPNSTVIGTTTAGEISHAKMYENTTAISLSLFENTKLKAYHVKNIDKKSGQKISRKICLKNTKAAIVLSEGLKGKNYEGFIKGIKKQNPELIIAGGLAGDNFALKNTFIFLNTKIFTQGAVAVSFSGKNLFADNKYNLNWSPIGKKFTITSSKNNIVYKIDGENAVDIFKKYLGSEIFKQNASSLPDIQLLYTEGSTTVSRTPLTVNENAIIFAGPLKEGTCVQFGFSNASSVISGSNLISENISKNPAEAIYIFSCIARKTLLGKVLENEFSSFEDVAPTAGFFTYGEFYSANTNNTLLNCTTTILILSENSKSTKKSIKNKKIKNTELENTTFTALTHFIKQTSTELNSNIKLLNQYKDVVDNSSIVSKADINGIITYVNDNFCKISKYSKEELLGKNHNIVRDKNVSGFIFKKMWDTIKSGKVWKGAFSNVAKDGSIYYVYATIMPIFDENDTIEEFIAIRQDITKQVLSKKRIQEKEKLIKAIFDNQDNIVIYTSKEKGIISANKKLFEYFNFESFEDFRSKHKCICDLFIEEKGYVHPSNDKDWLDTIAGNEENDFKAKMLTKNGQINTFNIKIKKIDEDYVINLSDITNLELAIQKAYSSEQAKSIFLANMSHEIRTPLNGILGFTDILTKKDLDKDTKRYIDIIHKSGKTLLNVVNDILDFSKIESGELSLYESDYNLFEEMEAAVSTFASVSKNKHIEYYTYIDTNIPKALKCDIQRLKQVINNLISNAIKFTPENGEVIVKILLKDIVNENAIISFSVKDSGIGIEKDKISTIFKAFSQADNSISREFGGTGLGLAISSRYINMMGSKLNVKSEEGSGSEFYFDLQLPISNNKQALDKNFNISINISVLDSNDKIICGINEIIYKYLKTWNCNYKKIKSINDVDESTDIVIVCAKLFDKKSYEKALNKFEKLQLIYIEGAQNHFDCSHKKFHLIEQPMTGSTLFDTLITLTNSKDKLSSEKMLSIENHVNYNGNILVAEDNETNQMLISILLKDRGLNYKIVNNGQEVIDEILSNNNYDIIFMDINMPVLDGISATKYLRKNDYKKPIISLSANVIESDIKSFKKAGVDDTLNKPIVPEELNKILHKYLNNKEKIEYDIIDIDLISKNLFLDKDMVLKLLKSFSTSVEEMLKKLESNYIDEDLAHSIKGVSGNLRLKKLYDLSTKFEKSLPNWSELEHEKNRNILISHLKEILKQIDLLNK